MIKVGNIHLIEKKKAQWGYFERSSKGCPTGKISAENGEGKGEGWKLIWKLYLNYFFDKQVSELTEKRKIAFKTKQELKMKNCRYGTFCIILFLFWVFFSACFRNVMHWRIFLKMNLPTVIIQLPHFSFRENYYNNIDAVIFVSWQTNLILEIQTKVNTLWW